MTTPNGSSVQANIQFNLEKCQPSETASRPSALTTLMFEKNHDHWYLPLSGLVIEALEPEDIDNIVVKSLDIVPTSLAGHCSDIYRADIEYIRKNEKDDEKIYKANVLIKDLYTNYAPNSQEYFTYTQLLPLVEDVLLESDIHSPNVSPRLYSARKTTSELHVLENMEHYGYNIADESLGFDFVTAKIVLEKLAKFHAASMMVRQKRPEIVAKLRENLWPNSAASFSAFVELVIDENIQHLAPLVGSWPGYEVIAEKLLQNTGANFERKFLKMFEKPASKINVINHGDFWIRNILLKTDNDNDQVKDLLFIDFQNCFTGSPAFDLHNFFMTSLNVDVLRKQHEYDYLIKHYFKALKRTLEQCNAITMARVQLPTFEDLEYEIERLQYFSLYALILSCPQKNLLSNEDFDHSYEPLHKTINHAEMFSNPKLLETLRIVLKNLNAAGVLD